MNVVHRKIVKVLVKRTLEDKNPLGTALAALNSDEAVRYIFSNYRGAGTTATGLHLTAMGLQLMKCYFKACEISLPSDHHIKTKYLVYLDKIASLPYHYGREYIVVFELHLGTKLKLADGDIDVLIDMEKSHA
jgi:hypothetical protein